MRFSTVSRFSTALTFFDILDSLEIFDISDSLEILDSRVALPFILTHLSLSATFSLSADFAFTIDATISRPWIYFLQLQRDSFIVDLTNGSITRRDGALIPEEASDDDSPLDFMPSLSTIKSQMKAASSGSTTTTATTIAPATIPTVAPNVKLENGTNRKRKEPSPVICLDSSDEDVLPNRFLPQHDQPVINLEPEGIDDLPLSTAILPPNASREDEIEAVAREIQREIEDGTVFTISTPNNILQLKSKIPDLTIDEVSQTKTRPVLSK